MGRILRYILLICCLAFICCKSDYRKEEIKTKGVVQEVAIINNLICTAPRTKITVKSEFFDEHIYLTTNNNINVGDTIEIEIILYKNKKDYDLLDYYQGFPKE